MTARILTLCLLLTAGFASAQDTKALATNLISTYQAWQQAMVKSDARMWQSLTSSHRQMEVRNRILSEKRAFPASVFQTPTPPPTLNGLKTIHVSQRGSTAKIAFYGKIDFGVGGEPTENIMVVSFINESGRWKYDKADFVNLTALPDVRKELAAGNLSYVKETPEFQATGMVPQTPIAVNAAKYIAKVYVYCPNREVEVQVNRVSRHSFKNAKEAEIVAGGAKDGPNDIVFSVKPLKGSTGKEALAVRVYLMSEIPGTKPIIAYEYKVEEGGTAKGFEKGTFTIDAATAAKLTR
ncbi:hypothetical protein ACFQY0_03265 [Haloferula chungangensis]|uniref:Uncharacterized protein n=1 Tax=Haloferula chungangensis TaxID=1048331 RepID=A0ABW2L1K0_9BACT